MDTKFGDRDIKEFARDILIGIGGSSSEANLNYVTDKLMDITEYVVLLTLDEVNKRGSKEKTSVQEDDSGFIAM